MVDIAFPFSAASLAASSCLQNLCDLLIIRGALEQVSKHLALGGSLLLGIQGPHHDYQTSISGGMTYSQQITPQTTGFIKDYSLSDGATVLMQQTTQYRTYSFKQAKAMLATHGLDYQADDTSQLFMEFKKR